MKKFLFSFLTLAFFSSLSSISYAACPVDESCSKAPDCSCEKKLDKCEKVERCQRALPNDVLEDDEYLTYNQCYLDKRFKKMKAALCLSKTQQCQIDAIYKQHKADMENLYSRYTVQKNKLLEMIACGNDCYKEQAKVLKDFKKSAKEKCKDFRDEVKEQLCKDQYSAFRKFQRQEKRTMKKLIKYGALYKFPCVDCASDCNN